MSLYAITSLVFIKRSCDAKLALETICIGWCVTFNKPFSSREEFTIYKHNHIKQLSQNRKQKIYSWAKTHLILSSSDLELADLEKKGRGTSKLSLFIPVPYPYLLLNCHSSLFSSLVRSALWLFSHTQAVWRRCCERRNLGDHLKPIRVVQQPPKDSVTDGALVFIARVIGNTHTHTCRLWRMNAHFSRRVRESQAKSLQIMIHVTSQFDSADVCEITWSSLSESEDALKLFRLHTLLIPAKDNLSSVGGANGLEWTY